MNPWKTNGIEANEVQEEIWCQVCGNLPKHSCAASAGPPCRISLPATLPWALVR